MTEQFDLMLLIPGLSYSDIEQMPEFERKHFYNKLKEYLEERKKK